MRTTDWNCDFSSLQYWDNREQLCDAYDEYHELPQKDLLCCLYSIAERRMLDYRGFLAIFRNKNHPELFLNISEYSFSQTFFTNKEENLIFLQPCISFKSLHRALYPILVLDIDHNRFSVALAGNTMGVIKINQNKPNVFTVELSGRRSRKIFSRWLSWHPLEQLPMLPQLIEKRRIW